MLDEWFSAEERFKFWKSMGMFDGVSKAEWQTPDGHDAKLYIGSSTSRLNTGSRMTLYSFFAQMGSFRVGPYLITMPDDMTQVDREVFSEMIVQQVNRDPSRFESMFLRPGVTERNATEIIQKMAEDFLDARYPEPNQTSFSSFNATTFQQKDYYLPALKVLNYRDGEFFSPARTAIWKNLELRAEHLEVNDVDYGTKTYVVVPNKGDMKHKVSAECDCGIYGSVNTEELKMYIQDVVFPVIQLDPNFKRSDRKLVIVEPGNQANLFIARKGWKASRAFISEIVNETISVPDASELLSMVWNRRVDVSEVLKGVTS